MSGELLAALTGVLLTLITAMLALPKMRAEARRLDAETPKARAEAHLADVEASRVEWQTLRDEIARQREEIDRQATQVKALRTEIRDLGDKFTEREQDLLQENKALHAEVGRLTRRVEGLESILKVTPLPNDMKALLAEIDRKTAKRVRP